MSKKEKKPVLLVKLGDAKTGWIPDHEHSVAFAEMAKVVGLTDTFNLIIYHYGIDCTVLSADKITLEEYGLQIVDENKFKKMVAACKEATAESKAAMIKMYKKLTKKRK